MKTDRDQARRGHGDGDDPMASLQTHAAGAIADMAVALVRLNEAWREYVKCYDALRAVDAVLTRVVEPTAAAGRVN